MRGLADPILGLMRKLKMDIGMVLLILALFFGVIASLDLGVLGQPANSKQNHGQKAKTHQPQKQKRHQHQVKTKQQ